MLMSASVIVSPWVTVIVGLGLVVEAFHAETVPISEIVFDVPWTLGIRGGLGRNRKRASVRKPRTVATENMRLVRCMTNMLCR